MAIYDPQDTSDRIAAIEKILELCPSNEQYIQGSEGYRILRLLGMKTPAFLSFRRPEEARVTDLDCFTGDRLVVKGICAEVLHKAAAGALRFIPKDSEALGRTIREMQDRLDPPPREFLVEEYVSHREGLGSEFLVGLRWTHEFGLILVLGPGGRRAEAYQRGLKESYGGRIFRPGRLPDSESRLRAEMDTECALWLDPASGGEPAVGPLLTLLGNLTRAAQRLMPQSICELEMNPAVICDGVPLALDVLIRRGTGRRSIARRCPAAQIRRLLFPQSIALAGVSRSRNPGRIILENTLEAGFDPRNLSLIKPGRESLDGVTCYSSVEALPERVDLLILAVSAIQSARMTEKAIQDRKAQSIILVPGGFEESGDPQGAGEILGSALEAAGSGEDRPVINGPNCLGIRSLPGRYDALFIPPEKLPGRPNSHDPVAFISQSGAMIASRLSCLEEINPRFLISVGNQMDLTLSDYLEFLGEDDRVNCFAVYVEGFRELDGLRFLETAERIHRAGKRIILYRGGRTASGEAAVRSHTAAVGGDYAVTVSLARRAGILVADCLEEFQDLIRLFVLLREKEVRGLRLAGAVNAGFECVALADRICSLRLGEFSRDTQDRLQEVFRKVGIEQIVAIHNPLDLTPMADDEAYEEVLHCLLKDPAVDAVVAGCVPLSPALDNRVPDQGGSRTSPDGPEGIPVGERLVRVFRRTRKPLIVVVDAGRMYAPLVRFLRGSGIPVLRRMDHAVGVFEKYILSRVKS